MPGPVQSRCLPLTGSPAPGRASCQRQPREARGQQPQYTGLSFFYETQPENVCWDLSVIPVSVCAQTEVGFTDLAGFGPQVWARTRGPPPGLGGRREGRTELLQDLPSDLDAD